MVEWEVLGYEMMLVYRSHFDWCATSNTCVCSAEHSVKLPATYIHSEETAIISQQGEVAISSSLYYSRLQFSSSWPVAPNHTTKYNEHRASLLIQIKFSLWQQRPRLGNFYITSLSLSLSFSLSLYETFLTPSCLHDWPLLWIKGARRGGGRGVLAETCFADTKCLSVLLETEVPIKLREKVI